MVESVSKVIREFEGFLPDELRLVSMVKDGLLWTVVLRDQLSGKIFTAQAFDLDDALSKVSGMPWETGARQD